VNSQTCQIGIVQGLFDRCVTGDRQAWRDLHRTYYPVACRFLIHMGITGSDLDDACQEVFVQVFRYLARFEHRSDFKTWLYKLCLSQSGRVRRRRKLQKALAWLWGHGITARTAGHDWSEVMVGERVRQALDQMRPLHREVFVLFALEGVEGNEIARILGCPATTVRRRLHDARQEFEQFLYRGRGPAWKGRAP
jgi:RNA polymerase sigma-70 factor (ECF subfamily)